MSSEIARQIAAVDPLGEETYSNLMVNHGMQSRDLDTIKRKHSMVIDAGFEHLESMINMSRTAELSPVVGYDDIPKAPRNDFEREYDDIRHDPVAKLDFDRAEIDEFLRRLGPTNTLRRKDGVDASFELARLRRLLQVDYEALPPEYQRPELRMTEALLSEELALLWSPTAVTAAASAPDKIRPLLADTKDPNALTSEQTENLKAQDRWKMIGARQSQEAAGLFREIANSRTASAAQRYEALCRATDMEIRSLYLQSAMSANVSERQALIDEAERVADYMLGVMVKAWLSPKRRAAIGSGNLFEMLVLGNERRKLMEAGKLEMLARLALPREDKVSERVGMIHHNGHKINLSTDVVVNDATTGKYVIGYQAKATTPERHAANVERDVVNGRSKQSVYDPERVAMRYLDDPDMRELVEPKPAKPLAEAHH